MVKIAVAGGSGNVATELLRPAIKSGKHEVTIFTRSGAPKDPIPGVTYEAVNYDDREALTSALKGVHTCLSFLIAHLDENGTRQKNLIHACIAAGVQRFAPSEWCLKNDSHVPHYANKDLIARYLSDINKDKPVLEYCLFQPSVFMDYFAHPYPLSPGLITWPFFIDFENRRAMILDDGTHPLVVTSVADDAQVLALALQDERRWPVVGGIRGARTTSNELLALGKKIRGGDWSVEYLRSEDIARGELKASWVPRFSHPAVPKEAEEVFSIQFVVMFLEALSVGAWDVSAEWNERFPEYRFEGLEEYLGKAWEGRA